MARRTLHFSASVYAPGTQHAPHDHDDLHLSLVLTGSVTERIGGATEQARALSVVAKDPRVRHADHFGTIGAVMARLSVTHTGLADLIDDTGRARDWLWTHDAFVARPFLRLVSRAERNESTFDSDDDDITDLLAAFTARRADPPAGSPPRWLSAALELVRDGWHPGLTVRDVAASAGVHPVYLARCMRRWYGTTTADELRRARLSRAAGSLARPATTVSVAAHNAGFSDEPHMCREFSRATGVTPGRYRGLAHLVAARGASLPVSDQTPLYAPLPREL